MKRAPGLLRFVALLAVLVAITQSVVAPSVIDTTGVLAVLVAGMGLVWAADCGSRAATVPATPPR